MSAGGCKGSESCPLRSSWMRRTGLIAVQGGSSSARGRSGAGEEKPPRSFRRSPRRHEAPPVIPASPPRHAADLPVLADQSPRRQELPLRPRKGPPRQRRSLLEARRILHDLRRGFPGPGGPSCLGDEISSGPRRSSEGGLGASWSPGRSSMAGGGLSSDPPESSFCDLKPPQIEEISPPGRAIPPGRKPRRWGEGRSKRVLDGDALVGSPRSKIFRWHSTFR